MYVESRQPAVQRQNSEPGPDQGKAAGPRRCEQQPPDGSHSTAALNVVIVCRLKRDVNASVFRKCFFHVCIILCLVVLTKMCIVLLFRVCMLKSCSEYRCIPVQTVKERPQQ